MAVLYKLNKFRVPQGFIVPSESGEVRRSINIRRFLETLLLKIETTLTMESKETGSVNLLKLYFTDRSDWFSVESIIKKNQSLIFGEALLAQKFLNSLIDFVDDFENIIKTNIENVGSTNIITDFLATALKPFFNTNAPPQYIHKAPGLVKVIWHNYSTILKIQLNAGESTEKFRPISDYMSPVQIVEQKRLKLFDEEFEWPSGNLSSKISQTSIRNASYLSTQIKYFLLELGNQLETTLKIESLGEVTKRGFTQKHTTTIVLSFNHWQWLANYSSYLDLDEIDSNKSKKRKLKLFEADLLIGLYNALLERLSIPLPLRNELNIANKKRVASIIESITILMREAQNYEFKCPTNPWEAEEWKRKMETFWEDRTCSSKADGKVKLRGAPLTVKNCDLSIDLRRDSEISLSEPNNNNYSDKNSSIISSTDIFLAEDYTGCTLVFEEIDATCLQSNENCRLFVNDVLKEFGSKLCIILNDTKEPRSLHLIIKKGERNLFHNEFYVKQGSNIIDIALKNLINALEKKAVLSSTECVSLYMGQQATRKMVNSVVNYFCELFNI